MAWVQIPRMKIRSPRCTPWQPHPTPCTRRKTPARGQGNSARGRVGPRVPSPTTTRQSAALIEAVPRRCMHHTHCCHRQTCTTPFLTVRPTARRAMLALGRWFPFGCLACRRPRRRGLRAAIRSTTPSRTMPLAPSSPPRRRFEAAHTPRVRASPRAGPPRVPPQWPRHSGGDRRQPVRCGAGGYPAGGSPPRLAAAAPPTTALAPHAADSAHCPERQRSRCRARWCRCSTRDPSPRRRVAA
mmetsp:Transcript_33190/g.86792  ORF Transcript_33190/g.86792 Transcript_33190/m.86792 type:complete len:242 (-) Transcript_33190:91-816(-)